MTPKFPSNLKPKYEHLRNLQETVKISHGASSLEFNTGWTNVQRRIHKNMTVFKVLNIELCSLYPGLALMIVTLPLYAVIVVNIYSKWEACCLSVWI